MNNKTVLIIGATALVLYLASRQMPQTATPTTASSRKPKSNGQVLSRNYDDVPLTIPDLQPIGYGINWYPPFTYNGYTGLAAYAQMFADQVSGMTVGDFPLAPPGVIDARNY